MNWWKRHDWIVVLVGVCLLVMAHDAPAQTALKPSILEGDARLACECLLCLAAGPQAPKECQTALTKYYLIQGTSPFQTLVKRRNFLQLCPKQ
ncbi:MAG TPA: TrbM/KikA/MpfK family conjugal transfer protein [Nitrospira sp.]|nr:TrbM/KikA/MpfK family conjugal transfer protein [Nitrospira sp.]